MATGIEAELKLSATDDAALDLLAAADRLGPAQLGPARTALETDTYLDTLDGRLAAARWACRVRTRADRSWISLKGPATHHPGAVLHRRPEIDGPVGDPLRPRGWPASAARDLVLQLAGETPLRERLLLRQQRTERAAVTEDDVLATLSLDRVEVVDGGAVIGRMRIVELELADPAPTAAWVEEMTRALAAIPGLVPEPASKLELALAMAREDASAR